MRLLARSAQPRPARSGARGASRPGVTLLELMVVLCIAGTLMGIAIPKLRRTRERMALRAAKNELATAVAITRGAAIQKGRPSRMIARGSRLLVTVDTAPNLTMTVIDRNLKTTHLVTLTLRNQADSVLPFDARGFARTRSGTTAIYALSGPGGFKDSVCVSLFGLVSKRGCIR